MTADVTENARLHLNSSRAVVLVVPASRMALIELTSVRSFGGATQSIPSQQTAGKRTESMMMSHRLASSHRLVRGSLHKKIQTDLDPFD